MVTLRSPKSHGELTKSSPKAHQWSPKGHQKATKRPTKGHQKATKELPKGHQKIPQDPQRSLILQSSNPPTNLPTNLPTDGSTDRRTMAYKYTPNIEPFKIFTQGENLKSGVWQYAIYYQLCNKKAKTAIKKVLKDYKILIHIV